ncbi:MAG TPA: hypothetical protein VF778_07135, partial [Xanthobacteraceae bacterium]
MRGARAGIRSGCGGTNDAGGSASRSFAAGSMNNEGFGASGRIVTSSIAAAIAALAAVSIEEMVAADPAPLGPDAASFAGSCRSARSTVRWFSAR